MDPDSPDYIKYEYFEPDKNSYLGKYGIIEIHLKPDIVKQIQEYFKNKIKDIKTIDDFKIFLQNQKNNSFLVLIQ